MKLFGKIAVISTILIVAVLIYFSLDLHRESTAGIPDPEQETRVRNAVLARFPGITAFETDGADDLFTPSLTVEIQETVSKTPSRLYWIQAETDRFDVFRTKDGVRLWLMTASNNELNLAVSDGQLAGILAEQPSSRRDATYLLIFSLNAAAPLRLHRQAENPLDNRYEGTLHEFTVLYDGPHQK